MSSVALGNSFPLTQRERNTRITESLRGKSHHDCSCSHDITVENRDVQKLNPTKSKQKRKIEKIKKIVQIVLETVCRVALTVIAFITDPISAGVGMAGGLAYGLYMGYLEDCKNHKISKCSNGGCAHGFLEDLSGVKFPKALNTVAAFGITLEHLLHGCGGHHHNPLPFSIFAGLAGVSSGAWIGKGSWHYGRMFSVWVSKKIQESN